MQNSTKEDEQDLYLGTNDIFRPDLKQIGNSLFEIRSYFIKRDGQSIAPTKLRTPLAQVKERLVEHIENHAYDFGFDPVTNEVVDLPIPEAGPCFMFLSHSLAVALDFCSSPRPSNTVCDVFLALPTQTVIVLSLVDGDEDCPEAVTYCMSVARGVTETLSRFTDEGINSIHGVIPVSLLEDADGFKNRLKKLANESSHFVTNDSLVMTPSRYEKVLTAFWAGVAETKSVLKEDRGDTDEDYLRFLTKEQCIILVENINSKDVEVKCMPGSGATTLMLEVARRLNRLGDTLLVCRSRQERDRLRSVYPSAVAAEDLRMVDMSSCVNIVDETNTVMAQTSGQTWRFTTYPTAVEEPRSQILAAEMQNSTKEDEQDLHLGTNDMNVDETNTVSAQTSDQNWRCTTGLTDIKELKSQLFDAEMEIAGMEKQIDALTNESWTELIQQILRDFSVLKIFSFKLGSTAPMSYSHEVRHTLEYKSSPLTTSKSHYISLVDYKQLLAKQEAWLSDIHDGLRRSKHLVPLLKSVITRDKTHLVYQGVKHVLLKKALGLKVHTESTQSLSRSVRKEGGQIEDFETEGQSNDAKDLDNSIDVVCEVHGVQKDGQVNDLDNEMQNTDVKDLESRWDEVEKLNQELNSLLKDRDHRRGQLQKVYTVKWQAVMEFLTRHTAVLSLLDIDIPGFEVFQSSPVRHGSAITDRVTGVLGKSAVSAVGDDKPGQHTGTSKRKEQRFHISHSTAPQSDNTNNREQRHSRAPGLMNQLRQYQQGRLTEKHLCVITMKIIREDEQQLMELKSNTDRLEKDYGSTVHVVGLTRRPRLLSCPRLHLDAARANTRWCHVTEDGQLVDRLLDTRDGGRNRLKMYRGTCSSPIPLPPSSSTLTPLPTTPSYWETETRVRVGGVLRWPVLEMGVCEAGQVDSRWYVSAQRRSWCVSVESCGRHWGSLCTTVWREGEQGECHQNTMSPTPGTQATLHYGVVLDVGRGRVAFIDIDRQVVLDKCNVEFTEPLVPMFSVGWPFPGYTKSMSLISGEDIDMTDTKKSLIYQALK